MSEPASIVLPPFPSEATLANLSIRRPSELRVRSQLFRSQGFLIRELMPRQSLTLTVGDSGLGKTPFLYQKGFCIASGVPFLGFEVKRGRVLYIDCENGIEDVDQIIKRIAAHLKVPVPEDNLFLWNLNDAELTTSPQEHLRKMISELRPDAVFIDPYNAICPDLERDNTAANESFRFLRRLMADFGCSIDGLHHTKKPDARKGAITVPSLESATFREWFLQVRGPRYLVNAVDVRIGIDRASLRGDCLAVRGFRRVSGELPLMILTRALNWDGEPIGYDRVSGAGLLRNPEHKRFFDDLPAEFTFKAAKGLYGKGDQATTDALKALGSAGLVEKTEKGHYRKCKQSPPSAGVAGVQMMDETNTLYIN